MPLHQGNCLEIYRKNTVWHEKMSSFLQPTSITEVKKFHTTDLFTIENSPLTTHHSPLTISTRYSPLATCLIFTTTPFETGVLLLSATL
jgi:hypothetical protein